MNNNFKKVFFSSLLTALLIITNLIGYKYTNFGSLIVSVNFITYPLMFLCILLLINFGSVREANRSILSASIIQLFMLLFYVFATKLGSQNVIHDLHNQVNIVFDVELSYYFASLVGFMISGYVLQYIYDYFRIIGYKLLGVVLSLLSSIMLYGIIFFSVANYKNGVNVVMDIILCNMLVSVIMTVLCIILYYILKDKEYPYEENNIYIKPLNIVTNKDKTIDEVVKIADIELKKEKVIENEKEKINNKKQNTTKNNKNQVKETKKVKNNKNNSKSKSKK